MLRILLLYMVFYTGGEMGTHVISRDLPDIKKNIYIKAIICDKCIDSTYYELVHSVLICPLATCVAVFCCQYLLLSGFCICVAASSISVAGFAFV